MEIPGLKCRYARYAISFCLRNNQETSPPGALVVSIAEVALSSSEARVANKHRSRGVNICQYGSSVSLVKPKAFPINSAKKLNKSPSEGILRVVTIGADKANVSSELFSVFSRVTVTEYDSR